MQCKDIERLIIVSSEEELSPEESKAVEQLRPLCATPGRFGKNTSGHHNDAEALASA